MPYIHTVTNQTVTKDKEIALKEALGKAIECIPGKTQEWLMLALEDGVRMAFRGDENTPLAMIEVEILGKASNEAYDALTRAITECVNEILGIPGEGIYIKYEEIEHWGYNGFNF